MSAAEEDILLTFKSTRGGAHLLYISIACQKRLAQKSLEIAGNQFSSEICFLCSWHVTRSAHSKCTCSNARDLKRIDQQSKGFLCLVEQERAHKGWIQGLSVGPLDAKASAV